MVQVRLLLSKSQSWGAQRLGRARTQPRQRAMRSTLTLLPLPALPPPFPRSANREGRTPPQPSLRAPNSSKKPLCVEGAAAGYHMADCSTMETWRLGGPFRWGSSHVFHTILNASLLARGARCARSKHGFHRIANCSSACNRASGAMSSGQVVADGIAPRSCGYVWSELNQLHNAGYVQNARQRVEPAKHWENPETKRRMHTLLSVSGLLQHTMALQPRAASASELGRVHDASYVQQVQTLSADESKGHHTVGDLATFSPGTTSGSTSEKGGETMLQTQVLLHAYGFGGSGRCKQDRHPRAYVGRVLLEWKWLPVTP